MGLDLTQYLRYAGALFFVLALIGLLVWALRQFGYGKMSSSSKHGRRLAVTEAAMVDKRRRLVLIRRDNQEHLVMIGGPQDLVIETGITPARLLADNAAQVQRKERPRPPPEPQPQATTRHREPVPRDTDVSQRPGTLDRERHQTARTPDRPLRSSRPDREPPVYSDRKPPDSLTPEPVEPSSPTQERRSLLNVRPGDTR